MQKLVKRKDEERLGKRKKVISHLNHVGKNILGNYNWYSRVIGKRGRLLQENIAANPSIIN